MAISWEIAHTEGLHSVLEWNGLMLTFDLWHCSLNIHSLNQENSLPSEYCWSLAQSPDLACFREIYCHKKREKL